MKGVPERHDVVASRIAALVDRFPQWLDVFDRELPFARAGQEDGHVATLIRWKELGGDVASLVRDDVFVSTLYRTLQAWGIGRRASRLVPLDLFRGRLVDAEPRLSELQGVRVSDAMVDQPGFVADLWDTVDDLGIVENATPMVPGTKALHHILPLLVVPIDRLYTGTFFAWSTARMQYGQPQLFQEAVAHFTTIARSLDLGSLTGPGWRSSEAKLIDNSIIGYCRAEGLVNAGGQRRSPRRSRPNRARSSGGKYRPLRDALALRPGPFEMTFSQIDELVGGLPRSARRYREWWANHAGNPQGAAWLGAGLIVDHVDLGHGRVRFRAR